MTAPHDAPGPAPGEAPEPARLVRALGHEVGNLLAAIRLTAHLLGTEAARVGVAEAVRGEAADIEMSAARAGALLAHLRPLLARGRDADRSRLPARELLSGVAAALEEHGARVELHAADDLPELRVDADALHHVLVMLVLGALERTRPAGVVRIAASRRGGELVLCLRDESEADAAAAPEAPTGRALDLGIAEVVLGRDEGRLQAGADGPGSRVEIVLPGAGSGS